MAREERREQRFGAITGGPVNTGDGSLEYTAEFPGIRDGDVPAVVGISAKILKEAGLNPPEINDIIIAEVNTDATASGEVNPTRVMRANWLPG